MNQTSIGDLPNEMLERILKESEDLNTRLVCQRWKEVMAHPCSDPEQWRRWQLKTHIRSMQGHLQTQLKNTEVKCKHFWVPAVAAFVAGIVATIAFKSLGLPAGSPLRLAIPVVTVGVVVGSFLVFLVANCGFPKKIKKARSELPKHWSVLSAAEREPLRRKERLMVQGIRDLVVQIQRLPTDG